MNAWLLTWEGTEGPATVLESKLVAILSGRLSPNSVESIVEVLYRRTVETAGNMANLANRPQERRRQYRGLASTYGILFYGLNPCIFARQVTDLVVTPNLDIGLECITWTDPAVFGNADVCSGIKEIYPTRDGRIVRPILTISRENRPDYGWNLGTTTTRPVKS